MKRRHLFHINLLILLFILLGLFISCSEISLFSLLDGEQEGDFSLDQKAVNVHTGDAIYLKASGGFLP